jgi:hypothetical protein
MLNTKIYKNKKNEHKLIQQMNEDLSVLILLGLPSRDERANIALSESLHYQTT